VTVDWPEEDCGFDFEKKPLAWAANVSPNNSTARINALTTIGELDALARAFLEKSFRQLRHAFHEFSRIHE
jgi:hypothetical protein